MEDCPSKEISRTSFEMDKLEVLEVNETEGRST